MIDPRNAELLILPNGGELDPAADEHQEVRPLLAGHVEVLGKVGGELEELELAAESQLCAEQARSHLQIAAELLRKVLSKAL